MSTPSRIDVVVYFGGQILQDGRTINYDRHPVGIMRISRSTSYSQFLTRLYQKTRTNSNVYLLKVYAKYQIQYMGEAKDALIPIEDDDNLNIFLDPEIGNPNMEVFVEKEEINREVDPPVIGTEWGQYMSMLSDQGHAASWPYPTPYQGASISGQYNATEEYQPDVVAVTAGFQNIVVDDVGTSYHVPADDVGTSYHVVEDDAQCDVNQDDFPANNNAEDPQADSFGHFEEVDSEPDEVECPIPAADDEEEVNIPVMVETLSGHAEGTSADHEAGPSTSMPIPQHDDNRFYRSIPFFARTFEEVPADSVDVPSLRFAKYYDSNDGRLDVGMVFKDKHHLICAVKDYSIRHARREYVVIESAPKKWKVACKHNRTGVSCRWVLRGIYKSRLDRWVITVYEGDHTCLMNDMSLEHGNLDRSFVASLLLGHVKCDPTYAIKNVIQTVKDQLGYDISYPKAWYSLRMAREIIYGTWESSVQKLPKYLGALQKWNAGTVVEWEHKYFLSRTGQYVIKYVFWAFRPCIEGFQFCRKVISVDGTHLYTKYKHKMLIAAAMDGNQQVFPLAFAIVDEESLSSWKWFLKMVSKHIIRGTTGICLISDRHPGLLAAVADMPEFNEPNGVHRYCLRHVTSNFNSRYKNVQLKDLCWRAGSEFQIRKFNRTMDEIRSIKPEAYAYLSQIDAEKWTASHDGGWRCGILTTNMSECINGVLKGARRLPVTAIVEMTFVRLVHYFRERTDKGSVMLRNGQLWTDYADKLYKYWSAKSVEHAVTRYNRYEQTASVVTKRHLGLGGITHVVKIATRECSCGKWSETGIPCSHAQKVCTAYRLNSASMVKPFYNLMPYRMTYSQSFQPIMAEDYWDIPEFELVHDATLRVRTRPGRHQTTRIHNEMDWPQARARQQARNQ